MVDTVYLKLYADAGRQVADAIDELFRASSARETDQSRVHASQGREGTGSRERAARRGLELYESKGDIAASKARAELEDVSTS